VSLYLRSLSHPDDYLISKRKWFSIISDKRFIGSWRGTFLTTEFDEENKNKVLRKLKTMTE